MKKFITFWREYLGHLGTTFFSPADLRALEVIAETLAELGDNSDATFMVSATAALLPNYSALDFPFPFEDEVLNVIGALKEAPRQLNFPPNFIKTTRALKSGVLVTRNAACARLVAEIYLAASEKDRESVLSTIDIVLREKGLLSKVTTLLKARVRDARSFVQEKTAHNDAPKALISISIDLAGSTDGKTRIRKVADGDEERDHLYQRLARDFLFHEDRFYEVLFPSLDWKRLFVVKGIGDEIWIIYEIARNNLEELRRAFGVIMEASTGLVGREIRLSVLPHRSDGEGYAVPPKGKFDRLILPFKVYCDLMTDATEISKLRADFLMPKIGGYISSNSNFGAEHAMLASRLNVGFVEAGSRKLQLSWRTDYIGHDVDKFFRTSKAALPGTVTLGKSLFEALQPEVSPTISYGLKKCNWTYSVPILGSSGTRNHFPSYLFRKSKQKAKELKGIGRGYENYHLVTLTQLHHLRGIIKEIMPNKTRRYLERVIFADVLKLFPARMASKLQADINAKQAARTPKGVT